MGLGYGPRFGPVDLSVKAVKLFRPVTGIKTKKRYMLLLARIHRRTPMDGVRTAEEG